MTEKDREAVTFEQISITNMYQFEALINVLERKGLVTNQEVMDELEVVVQKKGRKKIN